MSLFEQISQIARPENHPALKWSVKFTWPSVGLQTYHDYSYDEARYFAFLYGKKITIDTTLRTIEVH